MNNEFLEFVWLPTFERTAKHLFDEDDLRDIELALVENAERGDVIPGTGGFRKLRWAARGRGKRGGSRLIYFYVTHRQTIYMVLAYEKSVQENLTVAHRAQLKQLAAIIKQGSA